MSSTVPLPLEADSTLHADVAYLLLGNLRLLLEDPPDRVTSRWLLAVLDRLLAHRIPLGVIQGVREDALVGWGDSDAIDATFYAKLQRLRDRVAHHKPYALLGNEVRCDLCELPSPRRISSTHAVANLAE